VDSDIYADPDVDADPQHCQFVSFSYTLLKIIEIEKVTAFYEQFLLQFMLLGRGAEGRNIVWKTVGGFLVFLFLVPYHTYFYWREGGAFLCL
jgi:hypothetical protein